MTENLNNWVTEELEQSKTTTTYEKKPALKLADGSMTLVEIDFTKPFQKWTDEKDRVKAIVPCKVAGVEHVWWLNVKNPTYHAILNAYKNNGQTAFNIVTTGSQDKTRYTIIQKVA